MCTVRDGPAGALGEEAYKEAMLTLNAQSLRTSSALARRRVVAAAATAMQDDQGFEADAE